MFRNLSRGLASILDDLVRSGAYTRRSLAALIVASTAGGLFEAAALAVVAQVAVQAADGPSAVSLDGGPFTVSVSVWAALGVAVGCLLLRTAALLVAAHLPSVAVARWQESRRHSLWRSYTGADLEGQLGVGDGTMEQGVVSHSVQASAVLSFAGAALAAALSLAVMIGVAMLIQPIAAAVTLGLGLALYVSFRPLIETAKRAGRDQSHAFEELGRTVGDAARATIDRLTTGGNAGLTNRYNRAVAGARRPAYRENFAHFLVPVAYQGVVLLALVAGIGVIVSLNNSAAAAELGAVVLIVLRAGTYLQQIQVTLQRVGVGRAYWLRLDEMTASLDERTRVFGHKTLGRFRELTMQDVAFSYEREPVLSGLTMSVEAGEILGLAGRSGAGKSTLLQVLLRLRKAQGGTYAVNGIPADEYTENSWTRQVAFVPQAPAILDASIRENVTLGRNIDDGAILRALEGSQLSRDLGRWEAGLDRPVDSLGRALSGGQKQRLGIARALAGGPSLLIMDEPTSALDSVMAQRLMEDLCELRHKYDVTIIIAAHDLSLLESCDRVLTIDGDGKFIDAYQRTS